MMDLLKNLTNIFGEGKITKAEKNSYESDYFAVFSKSLSNNFVIVETPLSENEKVKIFWGRVGGGTNTEYVAIYEVVDRVKGIIKEMEGK